MKALRSIGFAAVFCGLGFAQAAQQIPSKEPGNFAPRRQASRLGHERQNAVQNPTAAPQRPTGEVEDTDEETAEPAPKPVTPQTPNAQNPAAPGQVKTPEQLLEDLRRMEQERRQQAPGAQNPRVERGERPPD